MQYAQLNEEWQKKQPIELQAKQVLQHFDPSKFKFAKVGHNELPFSIKMSKDDNCELIPKASVKTDDSLIIMNVSLYLIFLVLAICYSL